jgi:tetratricopeptide (TPR) repeat protein
MNEDTIKFLKKAINRNLDFIEEDGNWLNYYELLGFFRMALRNPEEFREEIERFKNIYEGHKEDFEEFLKSVGEHRKYYEEIISELLKVDEKSKEKLEKALAD